MGCGREWDDIVEVCLCARVCVCTRNCGFRLSFWDVGHFLEVTRICLT